MLLQAELLYQQSLSFKKDIATKQKKEQAFEVEEGKKIDTKDTEYYFVPDHLGFGCTTGLKIYEVSIAPFQSFFALPAE